ncbi:MAG TPA: aldo/keto reductase, partial [Phycisphaerae bacterium]|nr:aldo/keto reductase [Phycisphaerae bacterium]
MSARQKHGNDKLDRRRFLKTTAAGVGAAAVAGSIAQAAEGPAASQPAARVSDKDPIWLSRKDGMAYARLGRTNLMCSRIVAGWCKNLPLERLLARGVNYFDTALGYGNYEVEMKPFLARNRDKLFLISKATDVAGYSRIDKGVIDLYRKAMQAFLGESEGDLLALHNRAIAKAKATGEKPDLRPAGKHIAKMYLDKLDESLGRMGVSDVDSYFVHGIEVPWIFDCLELWEAYEKVHKAGKVKHFGYSTHKHVKEVMAAGVEANKRGPWKIDLVMPAVNPGSFDDLKPELEALKKQDVGIVAMKTKGIVNRPVDGREEKFKSLTDGKSFNEWERAKLWMLNITEGLVDVVIAAM